jgi:DnaK suppressor protein
MNGKMSTLDTAFIQKQRHLLTRLREQLLRTTRAGETEETELHSQSLGEAHESEDDAQKLAMLEVDGAAVRRNMRRLTQIERALQKIEDGTYGLSDTSGEPIPRERLEAMPEAIHTVSELSEAEPADDR